jgi:hypothetical protein
MRTTATTRNDDGDLEYNDAPEPVYQEGDSYGVNEVMDLWIDGELTSVHIRTLKVASIDREYVVEEGEWYLNYRVRLVDRWHATVTKETLDEEELRDTISDD